MINKEKYITLSLELHLFFARIMKEHALFLEAGFTSKNTKLSKEAEHYKVCFQKILFDTVKLSNGKIRKRVIKSGELITRHTLEAEKKTKYYTGININFNITNMEEKLECKTDDFDCKITSNIKEINTRAMKLLDGLIEFKKKVLDGVLCCELFTSNYPALIEHTIEEANLYRSYIRGLELGKDIEKENINKVELFWDEIMMEHSLVIRGLLDPAEGELINTSNKFADRFRELIKNTSTTLDISTITITNDTLMEVIKLRDFKEEATKGILGCKIKSVILPLLADHVVREANHYIRLLNDNI